MELTIHINIQSDGNLYNIIKKLKEVELEIKEKFLQDISLELNNITEEDIINIVCEYYKLTLDKLKDLHNTREGDIIECRLMLAYVLKEELSYSRDMLNQLFGFKKNSRKPEHYIRVMDRSILNKDEKYRTYSNIIKLIKKVQLGELPKKGKLD